MDNFTIVKKDGRREPLDINEIRLQTIPATANLKNVSYEELEISAKISFKDGMTTDDIQKLLIKAALGKIDIDAPDWVFVAGRLKLNDIYGKIRRNYNKKKDKDKTIYEIITLKDYVEHLSGFYSENDSIPNMFSMDKDVLDRFDLDYLNSKIVGERDKLFTFLAVDTLWKRYLIKDSNGKVAELPQHLFMGLSIFLAQNEEDCNGWAVKFYNMFSKLEAMMATPTTSNGRKKNGNCFSCSVGSTQDNIESIFDGFKTKAIGSKNGSGWGWDWTRVRANGAPIDNIKKAAGGVVPFIKIDNDTAIAVDQLGTRLGAINDNLETWHIDFLDFLKTKQDGGEERRRCKELFITAMCSDEFMYRVKHDEMWTLFDPYDCRELSEIYGEKFSMLYRDYEAKLFTEPEYFQNPPVRIKAKDLWKKIQAQAYVGGQPFIGFKDACNREFEEYYEKYDDLGIVRALNLCVTGDTKLLTKEYGNKPIGELVDSGIEEATCWNGEEWSKSKIFKTSDSQVVSEIIINDTVKIEVTPYHKWYVLDKNNLVIEKRTNELILGDRLIKYDLAPANSGTKELKYAYELGIDNYDDVNMLNILDVEYSFKTRISWLAGFLDNSNDIVNDVEKDFLEFHSENLDFINKMRLFLTELGIHSKSFTNEDIEKQSFSLRIDIKDLLTYKIPFKRIKLNKQKFTSSEFDIITKINNTDIEKPTYCGTEPKRHMLMFNGILTGNCTEYITPIKDKEVTVCNLASVNLARVPLERLKDVVPILGRALDNVIDITTYAVKESKDTQLDRRSIGMGVAGEAEMLANLKIMYGSEEHLDYIDKLYAEFKYWSDKTSEDLAKERGPWREGEKYRNFVRRCIAPTSSLGILLGTTNSIEAVYAKMWMEDNAMGTFRLTAPNINIDNIEYYIDAYEVNQLDAVRANAVRQKHFDMGISFNIYLRPENTRGKDLFDIYLLAWELGLKSTYYVRSESKKEMSENLQNKIVCSGCG